MRKNGPVTALLCAIALAAVAVISACTAPEAAGNPIIPRVAVARVEVTPAAVGPLAPGGAAVLTASVRAADGSVLTDRAVTWTSAAAAVATVSGGGTVTAVGPGTTTVTATSEGVSGGATVTVRLPVARVVVSPATVALVRGTTQALTARTESANGTVLSDRPVVWTSTNPAVAAVSSSGVVTAVAVGEAAITATSEGVSASAAATVRSPVASVSIVPAPVTLTVGESTPVRAVARDAEGTVVTGVPVTWSSGNAAVATISTGGVVTAVSRGTTVLTAQVEGLTATAAVMVGGVVSITIGGAPGNTAEVDRDTPLQAAVGVDPGATVSTAVTWRTDTPGLATISGTGVLQAHAPGPLVVTAISVADTTKRASLTLDLRWPTSPAPAAIEAGGRRQWHQGMTCALRNGRPSCWGLASFTGAGAGVGIYDLITTPRLVQGAPSMSMLAVGYGHACGLSTSGEAWCWGENVNGELAVDGGGYRGVTLVSGSQRWVQVVAGMFFSCALTNGGEAWCWGANDAGQRGNGSTARSIAPTKVLGNLAFRSLAAGHNAACGITTGDALYCWGSEANGVLGNGNVSQTLQLAPVRVQGNLKWSSVSVGQWAACGVTRDARAYCWGADWQYQLGIGGGDVSTPRPISLGEQIVRISSAHNACGISERRALWCWGEGSWGQFGTGEWSPSRNVPVAGAAGEWRTVSTDGVTTCAIRTDWRAACWGYNGGGRVGIGAISLEGITQTTPPKVIADIRSNGWGHTCRVYTDGSADCVGWNSRGQVGALDAGRRGPAQINRISGVIAGPWKAIQPEFDCTTGLTQSGEVWFWGCDNPPGPVGGFPPGKVWSDISRNYFGACALATDGDAFCDGKVFTGYKWKSIVVGGIHRCGIDLEDRGWCWGENNGNLGDGTYVNRENPVPILGDYRWRLLRASSYYAQGRSTCGITLEGVLYCWGIGPVGNGTTEASPVPVRVGGPTDTWVDISVAPNVKCGTTTRREVWCWGTSFFGIVTPGATVDWRQTTTTPVRIGGVSADRVVVIDHSWADGTGAVCAWSTSAPSLTCWGDNTYGLIDQSAAGFRGAFNTPQFIVLP